MISRWGLRSSAFRFSRRVGPGALAPRPLTEPDLWVTHPALWVSVSQVKQECLTRGRFWAGVQRFPGGFQGYQTLVKPSVPVGHRHFN